MATEKKSTKTVTPIDIDALVEKRLSVSKDELRQQILEEQLGELLQSDTLQEATLGEFLEQLKATNKEVWKLVSAKPIVEVARLISGADLLEKKLKSKQIHRRARLTLAELNDHRQKVLAFLKSSKEPQSVTSIEKELSMEPYTLKRTLGELRKANQIVIQGEKRATRYSAA